MWLLHRRRHGEFFSDTTAGFLRRNNGVVLRLHHGKFSGDGRTWFSGNAKPGGKDHQRQF
jgi:hypothetical protein